MALLLACLGLYGILSYAVARRTREIGIRMEIGAERRDIVRLVMRDALRLALIGAALGIPAALAAARLLANQLFSISAADPVAVGLATLILLSVAVAAGYLPAQRASQVDPIVALRREQLKCLPSALAREDRCDLAPERRLKYCIRRRKVMRKRLLLILSISLFGLPLGAASRSITESLMVGVQGNRSSDQKYLGLWIGTWANENGPTKGTISYTLSKDNKGQWRGAVNFKYQNQPEEYKADLQSLQITGGKMKAKFEMVGSKGAREFTVEEQFQRNKLEGSATISRKGSTDIVGKWTWKTTRSAAAEPGR